MFKIITKITDETREKRKIRGHNSINPWQKHAYDILEFFSPPSFIQKSKTFSQLDRKKEKENSPWSENNIHRAYNFTLNIHHFVNFSFFFFFHYTLFVRKERGGGIIRPY